MITAIAILVVFFGICTGIVGYLIATAPEGIEDDEHGFRRVVR